MMQNRGSNNRRKAEKSRELRGVQPPLQNHLNLFRLYFATTYAERQLYGEEISLSGRREDLPGRQLYGKEISLSGRREDLPGK